MAGTAMTLLKSPNGINQRNDRLNAMSSTLKQHGDESRVIRLRTVTSPVKSFKHPRTETNSQKIVEYVKIAETIQAAHQQWGLQVIGFTGVSRNQGISTLIAVLSTLIAENEKTNHTLDHIDEIADNRKLQQSQGVFLVDACLKHPGLHRIFGVENKFGLAGLLNNKNVKEFRATHLLEYHLDLLPAGANASPPFRWDRFEALIRKLKGRYRFIFVDLPPVLEDGESLRLCKLCDAVVLAVRANNKRYEVINNAKRMLESTGVNLLGGVLTHRKFFIPSWLYKRL